MNLIERKVIRSGLTGPDLITYMDNRKGFTLIELLVVVAVLALLASIVFSNLGGAREGARISNALSFQSQTHSLLGSDLVGWWNFNEGSGTTAGDISGYNNHGTIVGATYVDGVSGTGGTALDFNGSGDYVDLDKVSIVGALEGTVSAWIKSYEEWENHDTIFASQTGAAWANMRVNLSGDGIDRIKLAIADGESSTFANAKTKALEINKWYHIIGTYDGISLKIYVDGSIENTHPSEIVPGTFSPNFTGIGYMDYQNRYWRGYIDDVRIYSRALTASEVQTLYAQTKDNYLANE